MISKYLPQNDILSMTQVSFAFRRIFSDPVITRIPPIPPAGDSNSNGNGNDNDNDEDENENENENEDDDHGHPTTLLECVQYDPILTSRFTTSLAQDNPLSYTCLWCPLVHDRTSPDMFDLPCFMGPRHFKSCHPDCTIPSHASEPLNPLASFSYRHVQMALKLARQFGAPNSDGSWTAKEMLGRTATDMVQHIAVQYYERLITPFDMPFGLNYTFNCFNNNDGYGHHEHAFASVLFVPKIVLDKRERWRDPHDGGRHHFMLRTKYPLYVHWGQNLPPDADVHVRCKLGLPHDRRAHRIRLCPHTCLD